jgi:outer membrane murein-binding lipoprotein Lpp
MNTNTHPAGSSRAAERIEFRLPLWTQLMIGTGFLFLTLSAALLAVLVITGSHRDSQLQYLEHQAMLRSAQMRHLEQQVQQLSRQIATPPR